MALMRISNLSGLVGELLPKYLIFQCSVSDNSSSETSNDTDELPPAFGSPEGIYVVIS